MPFDKEDPSTPADIGEIRLSLHDPDGDQANMVGEFDITILDADGNGIKRAHGTLDEKGAAIVKSGFKKVLKDVRAQAAKDMLAKP